MVSRICCSVSRSFQTQSGPVLYWRGGFWKSLLASEELTAPLGEAEQAMTHRRVIKAQGEQENPGDAFISAE
jgi:hypothetical protein